MAGLLNRSSSLMCPHGGTVSIVTTNARVKGGDDYLALAGDTFMIAGCPFAIGPVPHPCVQVKWVQSATRSQAVGDQTLTEESVGLCVAADQAVQGAVQVVSTQSQVSGE